MKQVLNYGLVLEKVLEVIKFNQSTWLKSYNDMNTDLRKKVKNDFAKYFLKLMNDSVFGKPCKMWENIVILKLRQQEEEGIT